MIVVSDTSPINYLVLIELQDLLPELFQRVLIPDAVRRELQSTGAPDPIRHRVRLLLVQSGRPIQDDGDRDRARHLAEYRDEKFLAAFGSRVRMVVVPSDAGLEKRLYNGRLNAAVAGILAAINLPSSPRKKSSPPSPRQRGARPPSREMGICSFATGNAET